MNRLYRTGYTLLGILPFIVGIAGLLTLLNGPYTGFVFSNNGDNWIIAETIPGSPAMEFSLLRGARIVSIEGFELSGFDMVEDFDYIPDRDSLIRWWNARKHFAGTVLPGSAVSLTVDDGDGERTLSIEPVTMPPAHIAGRAGMMFFIGLFSLVVGLCVVFRKPDDIRSRVFFFMVFSVAMIFVTFGSYTSRDIAFNIKIFTLFRVLNVFAFSYFPVLFLHFCLVFPREKGFAKTRIFRMALYLLPLLVTAVYQPRISYLSLNLLFMAGLLSGIAAMIHSYFTARSTLEKYQIRWVIWGVGLFAGVFLITTFIPILFQGQRLFSDRVPSFFFVAVPLSMAFAITRYHILDIDTIFDTTIIYFLTIGAVTAIDLGVFAGLANLKHIAFPIEEPLSTVLSLWLAVLAYVPVRNGMNRMIKRLLRRDVYDPQAIYMQLGSQLLNAGGADAAFGCAVDALYATLYPKGIHAVLFSGRAVSSVISRGSAEQADFIDPVCCSETYERAVPLFSLENAVSSLPPDFFDGVLVPVRTSKGAIGCIVLANRTNGRLYSSGDLDFLNTVANQAALAIESFMRKEESDKLTLERLEERERISREIHDGIGSTFSNSIMLVDLVNNEQHDRTENSGRLPQLKTLLVRGLSDLRDFIWTVEQEESKIGDLLSMAGERAKQMLGDNVACSIELNAEDEDKSLPPMQRLNIIRILQEALTNIIKHSGAENVKIALECRENRFRMRIEDDGCGFDVHVKRGSGYGLRNIAKRCEEMHAECSISSEINTGTAVEVILQLPESSHPPQPPEL